MKVGLVGVFEDYQTRATGPSFVTSPGLEYSRDKSLLVEHLDELGFYVIHDPYYLYPSVSCFGANKLETSLCYLYASMAECYQKLSHGYSIFVLHSALDIYAEIMLNHRRQKWLEPVIQKEIGSYDLLVNLESVSEKNIVVMGSGDEQQIAKTKKHLKYKAIISRIIHDYKGKYERVSNVEDILHLINVYNKSR